MRLKQYMRSAMFLSIPVNKTKIIEPVVSFAPAHFQVDLQNDDHYGNSQQWSAYNRLLQCIQRNMVKFSYSTEAKKLKSHFFQQELFSIDLRIDQHLLKLSHSAQKFHYSSIFTNTSSDLKKKFRTPVLYFYARSYNRIEICIPLF